MDRIPLRTEPHLFDKPIGELQKQIGKRIDWLDHIFGLAEKVTTLKNGRRYVSANLYIGNQQYEQIAPCESLGNFCFFVLKDPQERVGGSRTAIEAPFYGIFWYNVRNMSSYVDERNREAIKEEILAVLNDIRYPHIEWGRIIEEPSAVFSDFSYDITDNQYMMSPYAGLRVEGVIRAKVSCLHQITAGDYNEDYNNDHDNGDPKDFLGKGSFSEDFNEDFDGGLGSPSNIQKR